MKCPKCHSENPDGTRFCGNCAAALTPSEEISALPTETIQAAMQELTTGSTFAGRYQVIEELGKGGMGRVYKVLDKEIKEKVALKLLNPEIASNEKTIERFRNELKFARKIAHKNVCRMYDLSKEEGSYYITMEYVRGEDLKNMIGMIGQLSAGKAIFVAKQLCEGLVEAHRLGVVHRDLKPQNIMIDREGNARIMDFGIARSLKAKGITRAGVMIGTPEYMSPEQAEVKEVDQRSDIYSLGVILYEMVTGRVPFEGETPLSIAMKHKSEEPRDPKELNAQIPEDLSHVILKCMEKDKEKRYQTAEEVLSELSKIEKGIPTTERVLPKRKPITSREITVKFSLRKLYVPALVILALTIVGVIIWQLLPQKEAVPLEPSGKSSIAIMYFENRSDEPELDKILVDMLTTNLSRYEEIEVVSSQRLFDILKQIGKQDVEAIDKNMATEVANRAGVKTMMTGSIIKIGNKIRITSQLTDVQTGAIIGSEQVEGNKVEEIFDMADQLTEKVSNRLGVSTQEMGQLFKIADVTTNSFEAYKYYRKGLENMWRFNFPEAAENFERAKEIDPTFAMAHLYLALAKFPGLVAWNPFTDLSSFRESIQLAKKHASRATDKERRFIDIYEAFYNQQYELADRLAADLVKNYPNDKEANFLLSLTSWFLSKYDQSMKALERTLEIDPTYANAYNQLAYSYSWLHDHQKAISTIKKYLALQPDVVNPYDSAWELYMRAGHYDDAFRICEDALKKNTKWYRFYRYQGYIHLFKGEEEEAHEKILRVRTLDSAREAYYAQQIGYLFLHEGRYNEALNEFQNAVKIAQREQNVKTEMYARFNLGKMFTELGQYSRALAEFSHAEKLSTQVYDQSFNPIPIIVNYLAGITMVKKRDYSGARAYAEKIDKLIQSKTYDDLYKDFYNLLLGELNVAQGNGQTAMDALTQVSVITEGFSPRYHILNAVSHAGRGEGEKAISAYLKFYNAVDTRAYGMGDFFYYFLERSKVDYHIARLYEKQGKNKKAVEQYKKFLDIRKNADPGIPEVEDAKERLAGLKKLT